MRVLRWRAQPSTLFSTPGLAADTSPDAARPAVLQYPGARRGLLTGILDSLGGFLGFGNDQAQPGGPKDTGSGAPSAPSSHEPTSVKPPVAQPSVPAQAPPASYPAPGGGGGQADKPTSSAPASVSSAPQSTPAGTEAGPAPHSTSPAAAMNVAPTPSTALPARESQPVSDVYSGSATSHTAGPGWPSVSPPANGASSSAPSPTQSPFASGHAKRFPLAAAAAIGGVLGFLVVSALFWAVWLALRKRRRAARAYPEFASVHPGVSSVSTDPLFTNAGGRDENPFTHPRDDKEDNPFELWRASSARSVASTLSV